MSELCIGLHRGTGRRIVEIFDDHGQLLGVIYPVEGNNAVHIVSKNFADDLFEPSYGILDMPGYVLKFKSP